MRAAPPVSVRGAGRQAHWRALQSLLVALAVGAFAAWGLGHAQLDQWPAVAPMAAAAALAWRRFDAAPADLIWDGVGWSCDGVAVPVAVAIDLGGWMLLRLGPDASAPTRWIALGAAEVADWHGLRTAVYAGVPRQDGVALSVEAVS